MRRNLLLDMRWLILCGMAASAAGCANMPGRQWFAKKSDLPSPQATVAKNEQIGGVQTASAKSAGATGQQAINMEIARGRNFERSGQWDKARKVYEDLRKREPESAAIAHRLGVVADTERRHGEAEQLFLFALQREPTDAQIMNDLGYCYYLQGKLTQAEPYLRQSVALQPSNARFRNNLGLVLGHMGREQEALVEFRAGGNEADAQFNLAFVYASQDRIDESKACFRQALALDPTHRRAREALASFEEYETKPQALREIDSDLAEKGGRWVPYQDPGDGGVQQAAAQTPLPSARDASKATRALQMQSRGLQNQGNIQ
jgi:tetratricopeptide (TPR) repeat protein